MKKQILFLLPIACLSLIASANLWAQCPDLNQEKRNTEKMNKALDKIEDWKNQAIRAHENKLQIEAMNAEIDRRMQNGLDDNPYSIQKQVNEAAASDEEHLSRNLQRYACSKSDLISEQIPKVNKQINSKIQSGQKECQLTSKARPIKRDLLKVKKRIKEKMKMREFCKNYLS